MVNNRLKGKIIEKYGVQGDFAQELGIQESLISKVIHGRKQLTDEEKRQWAAALGCEPQDVFDVEAVQA